MGLAIRNSDMRDLVEFAKEQGFTVESTRGKHIKFFRPGSQPIFTSSTPSDVRSWKNCKARLKRCAQLAA